MIDMPLTPIRVWETIQAAQGQGGGAPLTEQGAELDEHGEGSAGAGPASPGEGGAA